MRQEITKAVILVGGQGTRLRPLTYTLPKPLICFCNKPILKYQIEKLVEMGIKEVILALNYYSEIIIEEVSRYQDEFGIKIIYSKEDEPLGTAGPLALAKDYLKDTNFFVLNSDICCNADLNAMKASFMMNDDHIGTILTFPVQNPTKYGLIRVEGKKILSFLEKPEKIEGEGPWLINAGIYILSSKVLDYIEAREMSIENEVFPILAEKGLLEHFLFEGYWMDIGQPKDYLIGQRMELGNVGENTPFFNVRDNVVIGENVKIGRNCRLKNCTIFDYAILEDEVAVENSIVGWGCHIKEGSTIRGMSVLCEGVIVEKDLKVVGALSNPNTIINKILLAHRMQRNISKRDYRCYAHANPFRDCSLDIPETPDGVDWSVHFENGKAPAFIDIGCGYGKFLMQTARISPEENVLGLEIRDKVADYVQHCTDSMSNCSVIKTNALLFLPNFFCRSSLKKIFVLFPDPHFKKRKQKGRVICKQTMQILKYLLEDDGHLYISTDVKDLFQYMCDTIENSGCFVEENADGDPLFEMSYKGTDEANRAGIKSGHTFGRVYRVLK